MMKALKKYPPFKTLRVCLPSDVRDKAQCLLPTDWDPVPLSDLVPWRFYKAFPPLTRLLS